MFVHAPRAAIGHHDAGLDAAGNWPAVFQHLRSVLPAAFNLGWSDQGAARVITNRPRNHNYMPVSIGFVYHRSRVVLPNQGPRDDKQQRYAALSSALNGTLAQLYVRQGT